MTRRLDLGSLNLVMGRREIISQINCFHNTFLLFIHITIIFFNIGHLLVGV